MIKGFSLFSGGGIAETYFEEIGIHITVANELLPERAKFYQHTHPHTKMICGDITDNAIFNLVIKRKKDHVIDRLTATFLGILIINCY